jgi:imidazolonepropionase-like amidohydrolase
MPTYATVTRLWTGREWRSPALIAIDDTGIRPAAEERETAAPAGHLDLTLLPPLTDAHLHIGLTDLSERGAGVLARVLDLGWTPAELATMIRVCEDRWPGVEVLFAGAFLTAPGGYPTDREWAPPGSAAEVGSVEDAVRVVDLLAGTGAAVVKVTLNIDAGPVLPDETLQAIVTTAHGRGLRVVAHVEGEGQAVRALRAGVDAFAHTPWTQRLSDDDIVAMATSMTWISSLDMHGRGSYGDGYTTALENLTRFAAAGGNVVYGTDLGNAITRTDLNPREIDGLIDSGVTGARLLNALTASGLLPAWSRTASVLLAPTPHPPGPDEIIDHLGSSRPVGPAQLSEYLA